jgi:hypothetical protein
MSLDTMTQIQWDGAGVLMAAALDIGYGLYQLRNPDATIRNVARLVLWMGAAALAAGIALFIVPDETIAITAAIAVAAAILVTGVMRVAPALKASGKRTP